MRWYDEKFDADHHWPFWASFPFVMFQAPVPLVDVALYNTTADPYEKYDLSKKFPDMVKKLQDRVEFYMKGALPPANKPRDPESIKVAKENGAWTPWM